MKNYLTLVKICKKFLTQEKIFYEDQMTKCECRLSEKIDLEYEAEMKAQHSAEPESQQEEEHETYVAMGSEDERDNEVNLSLIEQNTSLNRSGLLRVTLPTAEMSTQTEEVAINKPKIPINRNCTTEIKSACAQLSSSCGISLEIASIELKLLVKHSMNIIFLNVE